MTVERAVFLNSHKTCRWLAHDRMHLECILAADPMPPEGTAPGGGVPS